MGYNNLQNILFSNSSVPNFLAWGSAISAQMAAIGWLQTTDTGQIVWTASVVAISNAVGDGTTTTYTYTLTSGPVLRVGMSIVVTGCTTGAFNQTKTITALGAGTFSVLSTANHASEGESGTGTVTAQAAVPSTFAGLYEVWQPGDAGSGLTTFYVQITYGNSSGNILVSFGIGTGTNGAGTLTGSTFNVQGGSSWFFNSANDTTYTDCYFCGASNRLSFMFRTPKSGCLVIERTKNSDGTDSSDGVYYSQCGTGLCNVTIVFGVGLSTSVTNADAAAFNIGNAGIATLFNNSIALRPVFPVYGKLGYPITGKMFGAGSELTEGAYITTSLYGSTRTYICSGKGNMANGGPLTMVRFD